MTEETMTEEIKMTEETKIIEETIMTQRNFYKVNKINKKGKIKSIYVFNTTSDKYNKEDVFSKSELDAIQKNNTNVFLSSQEIHIDDTIQMIKTKIMNEINNSSSSSTSSNSSTDEMYLFCKTSEILYPEKVFQFLTKKRSINVTQDRMQTFLSNIDEDIDIPFKEIYNYNDILQLNFGTDPHIVYKALGQKYFMGDNVNLISTNPFQIISNDLYSSRNIRSYPNMDNKLLLTSGEIVENNIYLCLAKDFMKSNRFTEINIIKAYYPRLFDHKIYNADELKNYKPNQDNKMDYFKSIDMFYDIYYESKNLKNLKYLMKGITFVHFTIQPIANITIPLEIIFKLLHATESLPLIKNNISSKQENIYRLYTPNISIDGRKIPSLNKATIFNFMGSLGNTKSLSLYIKCKDENISNLTCEIDEHGAFTVMLKMKNASFETQLNEIIKAQINPIIQDVNTILQDKKLNIFDTLRDIHVELKQMTYETKIHIKSRNINFKPYIGCFSDIFSGDLNKPEIMKIMRYKRVSNFKKLNTHTAFVLEKIKEIKNQNMEEETIVKEIAKDLLLNFKNDFTTESAVHFVNEIYFDLKKKKIRQNNINISDNPGFKTMINIDTNSSILNITMENIDDIYYLLTVPIYIDTLVRILFFNESMSAPLLSKLKLCSGEPHDSEEKDLDIFEDLQENKDNSNNNETRNNNEMDNIEINKDNINELTNTNKPSEEKSESIDSNDSQYQRYFGKKNIDHEDESSYKNEDSVKEEDDISLFSKPSDEVNDQPTNNNEEDDISLFSKPSDDVNDKVNDEVNDEVKDQPTNNNEEDDISLFSKPSDDVNDKVNDEVNDEVKDQPTNNNDEDDIILFSKPSDEANNEVKDQPTNNNEEDGERTLLGGTKSNESEDSDEDNEVYPVNMAFNKKEPIWQTRIEHRDPKLILKKDTPLFNSYSRTCSSSANKQPVILTDKQLEKIKKEHPNLLNIDNGDVIQYGSDPNKKFNYVCPRFWCLKTNTIVDPSDIKEITVNGKKERTSSNCGLVLHETDKKLKEGYGVYEFYKEKAGKKDYKRYPGLQPDKHPDGYCLPCCFENFNTPVRKAANKKCTEPENEVKTLKEDKYINAQDKFPSKTGKWGYLQLPLQTILHEANIDCQISKTNTNLKEGYPCLLRHGVERNDKQSFIACISDILYFGNSATVPVPTIDEMKEKIIQSIDIDSFIMYQNGNLVTNFQNDFNNKDEDNDLLNKYTSSQLYAKINKSLEEEVVYYKKVVTAFDRFIQFLRENDTTIDYTYLWDIISMPNANLFPNGVNLIIFRITDNAIELLCPTNHYSSQFYEARKPSILLINQGNFYEPIYTYTINGNNIKINKEFKEYDPQLSKTMRAVLKEIVKPYLEKYCKPIEVRPDSYAAKSPILLYNLVQKLDQYGYEPLKLVMNYNNKIIGVFAKSPKNRLGFVPCYPSSLYIKLKKDLDYVFMNDASIWKTYNETADFLTNLEERSKKKVSIAQISCKPWYNVIEDDLIIGILTETNQFVKISNPCTVTAIKEKYQKIPTLQNSYLYKSRLTDGIIATDNKVDNERVESVKKIRMENNFYNAFRNTVRILLNDYENVSFREKLLKEISKEYVLYYEKLKNVEKIIQKLVGEKVQFIGDENYYNIINELTTCIAKDKTTCEKNAPVCMYSGDDACNLILPEYNLNTKQLNRDIYFGKIADELIRYKRINSFMFNSSFYLHFGNVEYNLRENEMLILQSMLTKEYFEKLVPSVINAYAKFQSYDQVNPKMEIGEKEYPLYNNTINSLDDAIGKDNRKSCETKTMKIKSMVWANCFPNTFAEKEYTNNHSCTFDMMLDLIKSYATNSNAITQTNATNKTNATNQTIQTMDANALRNALYNQYKTYLPKFKDQIIDILIHEGKQTLGDQVKSGALSFLNFIFTDSYFLTPFDIWLIVNKFKIPTMFISSKYIFQTKYESHAFLAYGKESDAFCFIMIPGLKSEIIPRFKVIVSNNDNKDNNDISEIFFSLKKLNDTCENYQSILQAINDKVTVEDFLTTFVKPKKTTYVRKMPKNMIKHNLIVEEDEDEEEMIINDPKTIQKEKNPREEEDEIIIKDKDTDKDTNNTYKKTKKYTKRNKLIDKPIDKSMNKSMNKPKPKLIIMEEDNDDVEDSLKKDINPTNININSNPNPNPPTHIFFDSESNEKEVKQNKSPKGTKKKSTDKTRKNKNVRFLI